jgi:hypothetical protein
MSVRKVKWGCKPKSDVTVCSTQSPNTSEIKSPPINFSPEPCIAPECTTKDRKIQISDKFEGIYTTDYDIINIHHSILHYFDLEIQQLSELCLTSEQLKQKITETTKPITKKNLLGDLKRLEDNIENIKNGDNRSEYLNTVESIIPQYLELASERKIISFKTKKKISEEELQAKRDLQTKRLYIIASYLDIARNYIKINLIQETPKKNECTQCQFDFNIFDEDIDFCPQCGLEHKVILKIPVYYETQGSKATDEKNFIKEIKRFQGMQNTKIPEELINDLDKYFISYGMKSGTDVKKQKLNDDNEREGTTHEMLREALEKTGNAGWYEDLNLIANIYWSYPLPDISHLEAKIMEDYRNTQKAFLEIQKTRTSSLNTQYRLYKHLQLVGWNCKAKQFKAIKTDSIAQKYAELWKQMCKVAGLNYIED